MVTIFSTPKPWQGHIEIIQRNALVNWKHFGYEMVLFGNEPGTAEAAREFGCIHIPSVERSAMGTPLIGPIFKRIQNIASHRMLMYVNTDILFLSGLPETMKYLSNQDKALGIGTRFNIHVTDEVDFGDVDELAAMCVQSTPHAGTGVDYFIYYKGMFLDMPDFILGRGYWDTWLPAKTLRNRHRVIDTTNVIFAAHQNHDYSHLPESAPNRGFRDKWSPKGPETAINDMLRGKNMSKSWRDATERLFYNADGKIVSRTVTAQVRAAESSPPRQRAIFEDGKLTYVTVTGGQEQPKEPKQPTARVAKQTGLTRRELRKSVIHRKKR